MFYTPNATFFPPLSPVILIPLVHFFPVHGFCHGMVLMVSNSRWILPISGQLKKPLWMHCWKLRKLLKPLNKLSKERLLKLLLLTSNHGAYHQNFVSIPMILRMWYSKKLIFIICMASEILLFLIMKAYLFCDVMWWLGVSLALYVIATSNFILFYTCHDIVWWQTFQFVVSPESC